MEWDDVPGIAVLPTWSEPYRVSHEFLTTVYTTQNGDEQRAAQRMVPRKTVEYRGVVTGKNLRKLTSLLSLRRDDRIVVPEITKSILLPQMPMGTTTVEIVQQMPSWVMGGESLFISDGRNGEAIIVETVHDGVITFAAPLGQDYLKRPKLSPGLRCRFNEVQRFTYETSNAAVANFTFEVDPASEVYEHPFVLAQPATSLFRKIEFIRRKPNWAQNVISDFEIPRTRLDYGVGVRKTYFEQLFNRQIHEYLFTSANREETAELEAAFYRAKGRRGTFYIPTWTQDFEFEALPSGHEMILTDPDNIFGGQVDDVNRALCFFKGDVAVPVGIADVYDDGGLRIVELDNDIADLGLPSGGGCSLLKMARFASDTFVTEWLTDQVSQTKVKVQAVRDAFFEIVIGGHRLTIGGDYITIPDIPAPQQAVTPDSFYLTIGGDSILIGGDYLNIGEDNSP